MRLPERKFAIALGALLAGGLALAGCGKKDEAPKQAAGGELLPRSVTDDMPPYDTVTSQPPFADPEAALQNGPDGAPRPSRGSASGAAEDDEVDGPAVPASTPAPSPSPVRPAAE